MQKVVLFSLFCRQHLPSDNINRAQGEFHQRGFQHPSTSSVGGGFDRKPEPQRPPEPMKSQGPGPSGWSYEATDQDPGWMRYQTDDRTQGDSGNYSSSQLGAEYARQTGMGGYVSNQEMEKMGRPSGYQVQPQFSGQTEYSSAYQPPSKPGNDVFNASVQSSQSGFGQQPQQPTRGGTVSALKQPDSQTGGAAKKSVTFNENIGVTEFTINRSYGSTSSESSFPQSPEQNAAMRLPADQPPVPPPATYLTAATVRPNMPQQYVPSSQPSYIQHQRNVESSYPHGAGGGEPRYPYGGQDMRPPATPYKPQDQGNYQEKDHYARDPRYLGPSGGGGYPTQQYSNSPVQPLYSYQQDPSIYGHQPQQQGMRGSENPSTEQVPPNVAYVPGSGAPVIGAQEIYRDPRDRIMASKAAAGPAGMVPMAGQRSTPDRMSFRDKTSMFTSEAGE